MIKTVFIWLKTGDSARNRHVFLIYEPRANEAY